MNAKMAQYTQVILQEIGAKYVTVAYEEWCEITVGLTAVLKIVDAPLMELTIMQRKFMQNI